MVDRLPRLINCLLHHIARLVRLPGSTPGRALDDRSWRIPPRPRSGRRFATDAPPSAGAFGTERTRTRHLPLGVRPSHRSPPARCAALPAAWGGAGQQRGGRVAAGAPPPWVVGASNLRVRHGARRSGSPHTGGAPTETLPPRLRLPAPGERRLSRGRSSSRSTNAHSWDRCRRSRVVRTRIGWRSGRRKPSPRSGGRAALGTPGSARAAVSR